MPKPIILVISLVVAVVVTGASAQTVGGGGAKATDCWVTFNSNPAPNTPLLNPKNVKCADQNTTCGLDPMSNPSGDQDTRLGYCQFQLRMNLNSTGFASCTPASLPSMGFHIPFSGPDNDTNPKHIADLEPFQVFADMQLPLTPADVDVHSSFSTVTVPLSIGFTAKGPVYHTATVKMHPTMCLAALTTSNHFMCPAGLQKDVDTFTFTCTPPVDGLGAKISPCAGVSGTRITSTFQQLQEHIFDRKCSTQAMCHQSSNDSFSNNLCLDSSCGGAYAGLCGGGASCVAVTPFNTIAASDGLKRVDPGNPDNSLLIHKIKGGALLNSPTHGLGLYGLRMPYNNPPAGLARPKLTGNEIKLISDWIMAGAPPDGFVTTTAKGACQ